MRRHHRRYQDMYPLQYQRPEIAIHETALQHISLQRLPTLPDTTPKVQNKITYIRLDAFCAGLFSV